MWSFDLDDMIDYKFLNNKRFKDIFVIIDDFSENCGLYLLRTKTHR